MTRYARLLTVIVVAALALPPTASLAQRSMLPDLKIIDAFPPPNVKCIRPLVAEAFISVTVQNNGKGPAVMPPTTPQLGRYWVGVWDLFAVPGVMEIAAGPPSQLLPGKTRSFVVSVIVRLRVGPAGGPGYAVGVQVDPANLILESNENNNVRGFNFISNSFCQ